MLKMYSLRLLDGTLAWWFHIAVKSAVYISALAIKRFEHEDQILEFLTIHDVFLLFSSILYIELLKNKDVNVGDNFLLYFMKISKIAISIVVNVSCLVNAIKREKG